MDFLELLPHMGLSHPVYGMQARGSDEKSEPLQSIEEMAQVYLEAIKQVQPNGPYILVGYSLGGLVSLEAAQHLLRRGEKVDLLVMIDSYPHLYSLSLRQRARLWRRLVKRRVYTMLSRDKTAAPVRASQSYSASGASSSVAVRRVRRSAYSAWRRYRPQFYDGSIRFVKAEIPTNFPDNPTAVWSHLANGFEVETVPGDHVTMLSTHCESLGLVLNCLLRTVPCR